MRAFKQPSVAVPTLTDQGAGYKAAKRNSDAVSNSTGPKPTLKFPDKWNKPDVRGLLYGAQGRVCAFCGLELSAGDRGDVEHYRPKAGVSEDPQHWGYWWLAYDVSNYLLANRPCNSSRKGSRFPLDDEGKRVSFTTRSSISEEVPLILNPRAEPVVEQWFDIEFRDGRPPRMIARSTLQPAEKRRAEAHMTRFRWNSWIGLQRSRQKKLEELAKALDQTPPALGDAMKLASRYAPHSLAAKLVLDKSRVPGARLPTRTEELGWWVKELIEEVKIGNTTLDEFESNQATRDEVKRVTTELRESLWALACLLRDPPDGTEETVRGPLAAKGLDSVIDELLAKHGL